MHPLAAYQMFLTGFWQTRGQHCWPQLPRYESLQRGGQAVLRGWRSHLTTGTATDCWVVSTDTFPYPTARMSFAQADPGYPGSSLALAVYPY